MWGLQGSWKGSMVKFSANDKCNTLPLLILIASLPVYFSRFLSYHHIIIVMLAIIIITQISRRTQHFPPSLWRSTRTGMREIPVAAEFHPADTDFLYYSLSNSQSDALNEIPRGHYWSCEVSNGATAVMWFRSKNLFFNWKKKPQPTQDLWKTHDLDCSEVKYAEVSAPKLPEARLGGALRNLASWKMSLPTAVVLELYDLWSFLPTQTTLWCW